MKNSKIFLFLILTLALLSISAVSAEDSSLLNTQDSINDDVNLETNDEIPASQGEDNGVDVSNEVKSFDDLQKDIDSLSDNDNLDLNCSYKYDKTADFKGITIAQNNVTINGNGYTLDANSGSNNVRIFYITGNNVAIKNLVFVNANYNDYGGAIYNKGADFTLSNSTFKNNTAGVDGGAIHNGGVNFTVFNSTFVNNIAVTGGAIYNVGNGFNVINSTFINNTANEYGAGAIYNGGIAFSVINSTFKNNTAGSNAGAIFNSEKDFNVIGSEFINNTAVVDGGAIYNFGGDLFNVSNSIFINNTVSIDGGAIYNRWGEGFTLFNSTFINNTSHFYGGAVFNEGKEEFTLDFTVTNSTFKGNNATYGGAIGDSGPNSIIANSTFEDNNGSYGGAIFNAEESLNISNSTFNNNNAIYGSAIFNNCNCSVDNSIFDNMGVDICNTEMGILNLANNTFCQNKTNIYNEGTLNSIIVTVLENKTKFVSYGDVIVLSASVSSDGANVAGKDLYFIINGTQIKATLLENGSYVANYTMESYNNQIINATYNSTNVFVNTAVLDITSKDVVLSADDIVMFYHDGSRFIAILNDVRGNMIANATLLFTINGVTYTRQTDGNGSASLALNLDSGIYDANVLFNGSENYNSASKNATITIKSTIEGSDIVKIYQNGTQFYATFYGADGKTLANNTNVTFNINGVFYTRETNENGTAKLNINLNPGNYTLTAINTNGEQKGFNVLVKSLIESGDLTKYYQNASKFEAKIYNKDGSLAINKTVVFNINGVLYTRDTDENGTVSLTINLRPGNYTITTMYDGLAIGNNVCVLPTLETNDLSMKFQDGSKFQAKTLDAQGNLLANQNITFNINGVFYHKTTASDGVASLDIDLMKGEYIITSIWDNYEVANKIEII